MHEIVDGYNPAGLGEQREVYGTLLFILPVCTGQYNQNVGQ